MSSTEGGPAVPPLTLAIRSLGLLFLEGMAVGLAGWTWRASDKLLAYVTANTLSPRGRLYLVADMGIGALLPVLVALAVMLWKRGPGVDLVHRVSHRAAPVALVGLVPLLWTWDLWTPGRELTFLVLVGVFGLGLQGLVRLSLSTPPVLRGRAEEWVGQQGQALRALAARWPRLPFAVVVSAALGYAAFLSKLTIENHYLLNSSGFDLGIENNLIWNAVHFTGPLFKTSVLGGPTSTHLGYHQTYISYVFGILYRLWPRPETLLVIQSLMIGGAAVPLFLFARRHLAPWTACLVALLCVAYAPLHGSNLYDFHYLPMAPFFLFLCLWLLESGRDRWAAVAVVLTLATREDMSLLLAVVGVYLVLTGSRPRAGLVVAAVGAVYFVGLKMILMPRFLGGESAYLNQYADLLPPGEQGFGGVLKTVLGNPGFTVTTMLEREKLVYLLQIITPLAFFPWRRPVGLLCSLPGFFFTLLATRYPALNQIWFQYTAYWTSFLFIAVVANLAWLRRREGTSAGPSAGSTRAWLVAMTFVTLLTTHQFGAFFRQDGLWCGFVRFRSGITEADRSRHRDLYALIDRVPPRAKIAASEMLVAHVSSRPDAYSLKGGVYDAEYLLFAMEPQGIERTFVREALTTGGFGVVEEKGDFVLTRRGHPKDRNAALLERLP